MTPDELSALFDLDLDPLTCDREDLLTTLIQDIEGTKLLWRQACNVESPAEPRSGPIPKTTENYLRLKRLAIQRGYTPDWADKTYLDCYGVAYSSS